MKAAVLDAIGKPLTVQDVELDAPQAGEALVRIVACGVCHSDHSWMHGLMKAPVPNILGHEAGGVVEAVGPGVTTLAPGDHVIAALTPSCGTCEMCLEERPYLCHRMIQTMGNCTMLDGTTRVRRGDAGVHTVCAVGGFAERAVIPVGSLVKVDRDVPLDVVCLIGCGVTTGVGAVLNTANVKPETTVAVLGCGGVGLSVVQGARLAGARIIIAIDPVPSKRELAMKLGATHTVDPKEGDVGKAVKKIAVGGVHYAFEAIGKPETMAQAYNIIRPSGLAVVVGIAATSDEVRLRCGGLLQQKAFMGSAYGSAVPHRDLPKYVALYKKGDLQLDPLITRRIGLGDINDAFEEMLHGSVARSVVVF
jgi:S-(hydroxymethyl)glutathione dehydrogenase/alcohol dehydrogenase